MLHSTTLNQSMSHSEKPSTEMLNKLLKIDGYGWNIALFKNTNKVSNYLCAHCGEVVCDAVELGCHHDEDEIFLYCAICLVKLIKYNDYKCIINDHVNPQLDAAKSIRRQISKCIVICPYSTVFKTRISSKKNKKNKNNNAEIIDTFFDNDENDEKEGIQQFAVACGNDKEQEQTCEWRGTLSELTHFHINECAKKNDPIFALNITIKKLQNKNNLLKQQIIDLTNELNDLKINTKIYIKVEHDEKKKLKEIIEATGRAMNVQNNWSQQEIAKLKNENENYRKELNTLRDNAANNQKTLKQINNENKNLKKTIQDKEIVINKLNDQIQEQSLIIKDCMQSNDANNKLIQTLEQKQNAATAVTSSSVWIDKSDVWKCGNDDKMGQNAGKNDINVMNAMTNAWNIDNNNNMAKDQVSMYKERITTIYEETGQGGSERLMNVLKMIDDKKDNIDWIHALYIKICVKYKLNPEPKIGNSNSNWFGGNNNYNNNGGGISSNSRFGAMSNWDTLNQNQNRSQSNQSTNVFSNFGSSGRNNNTSWNWDGSNDDNNNNMAFATTMSSNQPSWVNNDLSTMVNSGSWNNNGGRDGNNPFASFSNSGGFASLLGN